MLDRLEYDNDDPGRSRRELDRKLEVDAWLVPGTRPRVRDVAASAPHWWHGDEDASQSFLAAMGVLT